MKLTILNLGAQAKWLISHAIFKYVGAPLNNLGVEHAPAKILFLLALVLVPGGLVLSACWWLSRHRLGMLSHTGHKRKPEATDRSELF